MRRRKRNRKGRVRRLWCVQPYHCTHYSKHRYLSAKDRDRQMTVPGPIIIVVVSGHRVRREATMLCADDTVYVS